MQKNAVEKNWTLISKILKTIYTKYNLFDELENDEKYLKKAFEYTETLWEKQFIKINELKVVMLSEAPLFGEKQTYIYNPNSKPTSFFYFQNLQAFPTYNSNDKIPKSTYDKKKLMFEHFRENGFLVLDIFPFALNPAYTAINYRKMPKKLYNELFASTANSYLIPKLKRCLKKMQQTPCFAYRYKKLNTKTGDLINQAFQTLFNSDNFILTNVYGKNMPLDRGKLTKLL